MMNAFLGLTSLGDDAETEKYKESNCDKYSVQAIPEEVSIGPQSGYENSGNGTTSDNSIMRVAGDTRQENVKFSDQLDPYVYKVDSYIDSTRKLQDSNDALLENFFSRPIKIHEIEWSTSTTMGGNINPWKLYFENQRVLNRLTNFSLMRANLHVKIVINGNGFQYGRGIAAYLPMHEYDSLSGNSSLVIQDMVQTTQLPHVYLDPTTSQGGELVLPFFNYKNYASIPNQQWGELGTMWIRTLNTLKHANGASDVVTISVFAWAEDVEMSVLTSVEPGDLGPQSGTEVDEVNEKGTVSGPATAIAKFAGSLTSVPYIAPFAQATQMAATTTASIAKMFGYCRPPVTKDQEPYKPNPASSLALTNVGDGLQKLTVDNKQELSIDPRISGLGGVDPLNIKEIAKRESYLTKFTWSIGTAPETLLWNMRLDPCIWAESGVLTQAYHFPACAMAALPFKYWTGTMRVRFQIVCSAFHKGRIKAVYDPNYFQTNEYNTNYLTVVDIADKTDFTVEIANGQDQTLLSHAYPGKDSVTTMYSTTPYISHPTPPRGNGVLGLYVVNELTTPNSTVNNDIEVNVFVSMGDDFEVFVPDDHIQNFVVNPQSGFETQSGMEGTIVTESQNTTEPSAPQQEEAEALGPTMSNNADINVVFTGESIASFRTLLKRYNLWSAVSPQAGNIRAIYGRFNMFPYLRGNVAGAIHETALLKSYNYCNTILLHWVTTAFSGWRGSIRYKWLPRGTLEPNGRPTMYVQRQDKGNTDYKISNFTPRTYASSSDAADGVVTKDIGTGYPAPGQPYSGIKGQMYQSGYVNPAIEFEIPYYSSNRFTPGKQENLTVGEQFNEGYDYYLQVEGTTGTAFDIHVAAGEDFTTYFFTGLPRMYYEPIPPAPSVVV